MTSKKSLIGNLFLLLAAIAWGMAFTAQKLAAETLPPFSVNAIRFLMGGIVLIPAILIFDRATHNGRRLIRLERRHPFDITRAELIGGVTCGVVLFFAATLQQISLTGEHVGPGKASFLTALYVVFVPLFGLLRRKIAPVNVWVSVGIAVIGAYLLTMSGDSGFTVGGYDLLLIVSAFFFALHIVVIDIFVPHTDPLRVSMIQFLTAGVLGVPLMLLVDPHIAPVPTGADIVASILPMLYLGIISCGIGYTVQMLGQKISATPTIASLVMSLESVVGLVGGILILDEVFAPRQLIGCAVIFFAVTLSQLPVKAWVYTLRHREKHPTASSADEESND